MKAGKQRSSAAAILTAPLLLSLLAGEVGCSTRSPFHQETERDLRRAVIDSARRELEDAQKYPKPVVSHREGIGGELTIQPEVMTELKDMAGMDSYKGILPDFGKDMYDRPARSLQVSLERMVRTAIENNVAVQFARLGPAISEAQVAAAEAAFDWTFFTNLNYTNQDSPRTGTSFGGTTFTPGFDKFTSMTGTSGVRRVLVGGGRLTIQEDLSYTDNSTPGQQVSPNPAEQAAFTLQWDQPLLKGAGSEVSQAEIRVQRNAERTSVQTLRRDLIRIVGDVEKTYWQLAQSYADLLIVQRLQERGEKTRDQLRAREKIDANQAQIADAVSRVERRKGEVLQIQTRISQLSDRLKALVNDPALPAGSEILVLPSERPIDAPIKFSLLDSMRQAIQNRPEVQQAIIAIDDASIRQMVARNQRLPDLNMRLQSRWSSLDNNMGAAVSSQFNGEFIDYIVGASLEIPIGNRKAEAEYRRRRLERMQTVLAYKNAVQTAVTETKSALKQTLDSYRRIAQAADARIAAANVLRVLLVEKQSEQGTTVERLDLELTHQERLAQAEREEVAAHIEYNSNLADLFAAMGTALERNKIEFVVPTTSDVVWEGTGR